MMALALMACSRAGSTGHKARTLAVSIEPLRALLDPLAQGRFEVTGVMDRGGDPENFEPSMSRRMAVDGAEAFFMAGGLPFEQSLAEAAPAGVVKVELAEVVEPVYGTHDNCGHAHHHHGEEEHGLPDPHIWTSVRNARRMAAAMAATLSRLDPEGAPLYAARLDSLDGVLASLDSCVARTLDSAPSRAFMLWHPSLSYLARDYGLEQVALGSEGKDFSAAQMREAIERGAASGARVFFVQRGLDPRQAGSVCSSVGARAVEIDPMAYDWQNQIKTFADELARQ